MIWTFNKNASYLLNFYFVTIKFISQLHTTNIYSLIDRLSLVPSCATEATSGCKDLQHRSRNSTIY